MYKYYNNGPYLAQVTGSGQQLHQALKGRKLLIGTLVLSCAALVCVTIAYQRQRTLIRKPKEPEPSTG